MKQKFFFMLAAALFCAVAFTSCSKDKDDDSKEMVGDYFAMPCIDWKASKATVKSYMSDYEIINETSDIILYDGKYKEDMSAYNFESSKLSSSFVYISEISSSYLKSWMNSVCKDVDEEKGIVAGESKDGKSIYGYQYVDGEYIIVFLPNTLTRSGSAIDAVEAALLSK